MTQDVSLQPETQPWKKAIPEARDRLQSKILVWIAVPVLCFCCYAIAARIVSLGRHDDRIDLLLKIAISLFFALIAWRLKAATPLAAAVGGSICFLLTEAIGTRSGASVFHSGLTPLILLFLLTREATRMGRKNKEAAGLAESRRGRDAAQIVANLGVAGLCSSMWGGYCVSWAFGGTWAGEAAPFFALFQIPMLAALAEATADTVSSEVGQASGGRPFMLTTLRRVDPGTDGAVSLVGTFAGVLSALAIALVGIPSLGMSRLEALLVFASAVFGLFFDSLLGATIERKGWLGNDLVNLLSTGVAAGTSVLGVRIWGMGLFH